MPWSPGEDGVVALPSGVLVRGRALRRDLGPADLTLVLVGPPFDGLRARGGGLRARAAGLRTRGGAPSSGSTRTIAWPDFGVPLHRDETVELLREAYARARAGERVEVACRGGVGRTGTALAALAVLDGSTPDEAVAWVRAHHHPRAVETPFQRWWLRHLTTG